MDCYESESSGYDQATVTRVENDERFYVSDLQLAAELGKTLLERNQDLEGTLKQQQTVIDEQAQEIEFLSRQSAALKEVNESRLRIYEQLEVSVTELEKTNQKLLSESSGDKKRIRRLCDSVGVLETKCDDLQKMVDELKTSEKARKRERNRTVVPLIEEVKAPEIRRRFSIENGSVSLDNLDDLEVVKLRSSVSRLTAHMSKEQRKSEELKAQVSLTAEENLNLREQVTLLQEQQERLVFFHQAERLYWACHQRKESKSENHAAIVTEVEPGDEPNVGPCALVQLKNGAVAYGSQESLASVGLVMNNKEPVETKISQRNCISLLSELDAQYRAIIEKYEDLLHARRQQVSDYYGDMSLNSMTSVTSTQSMTARSLSEELSEASDLSSGFSDSSEKSFTEQGVQTDAVEECLTTENPVSGHFKASPQYKQLFQDIFDILKRPAAALQVPPTVAEVPEVKTDKKKRHYPYANPKRNDNSQSFPCPKPSYCVSPQSLMGYPVFKLPGVMSYAEALERGSKRGKPLFKH